MTDTKTNTKTVILDGAMGTMLQGRGLGIGEKPEVFALRNPLAVEEIQRDYVKAGSTVLYSNTFGANRRKLEGSGHTPEEVISANIAIAGKAAGKGVKVALDIGPIGELMKPLGTLSFDDAYDIFREMLVAGEKAGADLVVFETFTDLQEVRAAVLAAKENTSLPVWVTMSFEQDGRTFTGTTVSSMAVTLQGLGVDAMGINCSLGPQEILPLIREMRRWTDLPLIAKPNAGLPDPATGSYFITPQEFADSMVPFISMGVGAVGGCCGTGPAFIKALAEATDQTQTAMEDCTPAGHRNGVCSASAMAEYGKTHLIGERINPTGKKRLKQALIEHDMDYIMKIAIEQADAGADILDINVGIPNINEASLMAEVVQAVQSVVGLPLMIDSSRADAIEAGLRYACGKAIINSVSADDGKLEQILPLARKYGAAVVGLTMEKKLPMTVEERIGHAMKIADRAVDFGIPREDIIIDCLTLTVSAQQDQALKTLEAVRQVRRDLGLHAALGVSNIAYGLPEKTHVTSAFLTMALQSGLDFPIINVNSRTVMDSVASYRALSGEDIHCEHYIQRFTEETTDAQISDKSEKKEALSLEEAIIKGLGQETENSVRQLLETMDALDVVNLKLIPALDKVGDEYERHEIFLPQLINAANAAGRGFELIRKKLPRRTDASKGKIIIATVEGDIHDIGKNIVKVVLENYGYNVIDLGKDVPVETVVERTVAEGARLVALSALMTTTVESMKRTITALRDSGHDCRVMVGGAVLTAEYARQIGADYYTKDPKESADVARRVLGE